MINLTKEQRDFVDQPTGTFVTACPGSGKTRAIVERVARIAPALPPRKGIAVLSFTNIAIEEFKSRFQKLGFLEGVLHHPGFVGTFDSFVIQLLFEPAGMGGVRVKPTVVNSWRALNIEIRLTGRKAWRGRRGAELDLFDAMSGEVDPQTIGDSGLRAHVTQYKADYETAARRTRERLRRLGYVSVADVRMETLKRLNCEKWSSAMEHALAARFKEVIVDEAQDCNAFDYEVIRWLRRAGIEVSTVGDPDQAIYGFRGGDAEELTALADDYDADSYLSFTGNFRSSPSICALAATLRNRRIPDQALGKTSEITTPIQIMSYPGNSVNPGIGRRFIGLMEALGYEQNDGIILAHSRSAALRASGADTDVSVGGSRVAIVAKAIGDFWSSPGSGRAREEALQTMEKIILGFMGLTTDRRLPRQVAETCRIDLRWLRRSALSLITDLPRECAEDDAARRAWVEALRSKIQVLDLPYSNTNTNTTTTSARYFPNPNTASWTKLLVQVNRVSVRCATVHEAKGTQYKAVC